MRRAIWSMVFAGMATLTFSQGSFTIVRPFDGAKVRETVRVLMPKNSIPASGYIGVFLNGEFREAVQPKLNAKQDYYEYLLNTKDLADGTYKFELKLFVDYNGQPRIVDTSSIDMTVSNKTGIVVPEDGITLRYRFNEGTERIYRLQQKTIINVIGEKDQKAGARAFQIQEDGETIRLLFACDNAYGNGDGLLRMQVIPDKGMRGREYAFLTPSGETSPKKYYPADMAAIYMRITPVGREVFGAVPDYFGIDGTGGQGPRFALFATFPLPILPSKPIRPGDTWRTAFQLGNFDKDNRYAVKSVVTKVEARGECVGVEWEMGHPCAVIKNSIAEGTAAPVKAKGGDAISGGKIQMEETIWFALDTRQVIKYYRDITQEGKIDLGFSSSGGGAPQGGAPAGGGRPGMGAPGGTGSGSRTPDDFSMKNKGQRGAPPGGGRPPGAGGPPQGAGGPQGGPPQGQGQQQGLARVRNQYLVVLEK